MSAARRSLRTAPISTRPTFDEGPPGGADDGGRVNAAVPGPGLDAAVTAAVMAGLASGLVPHRRVHTNVLIPMTSNPPASTLPTTNQRPMPADRRSGTSWST